LIDPPPGIDCVPEYEDGWIVTPGERVPFLSYVDADTSVNWSAELEFLHEEASRSHFIDQWTRTAIVTCIGPLPAEAMIADVGCSTGYLLEDLAELHPDATLYGVDLISSGLRRAHQALPRARLLHADACALPFADATVAALVSANLLEHVPDDRRALAEIARVLAPGRRAVIVVPAGPGTYDYYDRFLGHERRYGRGELAAKGRDAGLGVVGQRHIGALLYPAFWLVKKRNRIRHGELAGEALEQQVTVDIGRTRDSRVGRMLWRLEDRLVAFGLRPGFGIRSLVVFCKPGSAL
jgi:SAM-dependent methyltransferase